MMIRERGSEVGPGQEEAKGGDGGGQVRNLSGEQRPSLTNSCPT